MGNYFGRKKEDGNDPTQDAFYGVEVKKSRSSAHTIQTVYRPHIFIDFYKSELFKVSSYYCKNNMGLDLTIFANSFGQYYILIVTLETALYRDSIRHVTVTTIQFLWSLVFRVSGKMCVSNIIYGLLSRRLGWCKNMSD